MAAKVENDKIKGVLAYEPVQNQVKRGKIGNNTEKYPTI